LKINIYSCDNKQKMGFMLSSKLSKSLDSIDTINQFLSTVKKEDVKIGAFGGRTFTGKVGDQEFTFKMNDLIKHTLKKAGDLHASEEALQDLKQRLSNVNQLGEEKLRSFKAVKGCIQKIQYALTRFKQQVLKTVKYREGLLPPPGAIRQKTQEPPRRDSREQERRDEGQPTTTAGPQQTEPQPQPKEAMSIMKKADPSLKKDPTSPLLQPQPFKRPSFASFTPSEQVRLNAVCEIVEYELARRARGERHFDITLTYKAFRSTGLTKAMGDYLVEQGVIQAWNYQEREDYAVVRLTKEDLRAHSGSLSDGQWHDLEFIQKEKKS
jgi:hypothetical protein